MRYKDLFFILPLFIITCNNQPEKTTSAGNRKINMTQKHIQDSLQAIKKLTDVINLNVKAFYHTVDSLKLEKGMFPVEDYLSDTVAGDDYKFALFYLKFMAAAKIKDKVKITAMIHFPFQTTRQKVKYNKKYGDYEVAGAENWKGGLINEKQFDVQYNKIFTDEILENIPETRPKDIIGSLPGNVNPDNDYEGQLQFFTDKGSNIYSVSIELPVKKRKFSHVRFEFGRVKGEYKILSYFLE